MSNPVLDPVSGHAHSRPADGVGPAGTVWLVAEEVPVAFEYNKRSHAVMMATPADLEDFALGFSLCEEIVGAAAEIEGVTIREEAEGIVLSMAVDRRHLLDGVKRRRTMEGRSGCGLCGVSSLASAVRRPRRVTASFAPSVAAIAAAFARLPDHQPMNRANRSLHAAAWCDPDGRILMAREDVGRHNALDKLVGALARAGTDPSGGFALMSSRCSFELVQKAATFGIPMLASVSAPTALALNLARDAGMTLAARSGRDGVMLFH
ncbi:formate dehydrogenase accessory sulfurtransferase FdhD [Skermanella mucosa]|uniref:formate dehydrogenase accessory sulfurtransferase FdhD n=1 Tax=Skermanella mucosa TaxID=1789672 RepID=UPI00192BAD1A|nr:formate dehydrogenase accessory sulfurtransferase FdhD [Skermanella mucosa]UEM19129.1 formate dehydrogenase accessory sulfurtransferase FdhD [Skermanella mucosa]